MRAVEPAGCAGVLLVCLLWAACAAAQPATESAVTVLADFEDDVVAASIRDVENILAAECTLARVSIPARGTASLAFSLGATRPNASAAFHLTFREAQRFAQLDRVAALVWINDGAVQVAFRLMDARGNLFETAAQSVSQHYRWVRVAADAGPAALRAVHERGVTPVLPLRLEGARVATRNVGKQTVFIDDLQVEHRVAPAELVRGDFTLSESTRMFEPGAQIGATFELENRSRRQALALSVELSWRTPDDTVLHVHRATVSLPASGSDFRSRQRIDFSHALRDPGLYRLVARLTAPGWPAPAHHETSVAVTPPNRQLRRGRSTFFGVGSTLLRESLVDQRIELSLARDVGADLLAVEVPWLRLEARAGTYDFSLLDPIIDGLARADLAALAILSQPPEGAVGQPERLRGLLSALGQRYGDKLQRFLLMGELFGEQTDTERLAAALALAQSLTEVLPRALIWPPPLRLGAGEPAPALVELAGRLKGPLMLETEGATLAAVAAARAFQQRAGLPRRDAPVYWLHRPPPLAGLGSEADAVDVLRHFVQAAAAGASGLIWRELRDGDDEPAHGLVRRDFSPRSSLLGYSAVAGQLTGLGYKGDVLNAPEECDSALFIGSDRQIAVLIPRPNRILPAVLAPLRGVEGEIEYRGFDRLPRELLHTSEFPLIVTSPGAMFVRLMLTSPQPEPQIGFTRPWLRCPGTVFCGAEAAFSIEVEAPLTMARSFVQLELPPEAPFGSDFSVGALRLETGATAAYPVTLTELRPFEQARALLNFSLEGRRVAVPLRVLPLAAVARFDAATPLTAERHRLGAASAKEGGRASELIVHAGWQPAELRILAILPQAAPSASAARLSLGVVREGGDTPGGIQIGELTGSLTRTELFPAAPSAAASWQIKAGPEAEGNRRSVLLSIPAESLGVAPLAAGDRIRLAVRYEAPEARSGETILEWGRGLGAGRATDDYRWLQLVEGRP